MIEYLYDCIVATTGLDAVIGAEITDEGGAAITEGCSLMLSDEAQTIGMYEGVYNGNNWEFTIPAAVTATLTGRYFYCIHYNDTTLCFKQEIYFMG